MQEEEAQGDQTWTLAGVYCEIKQVQRKATRVIEENGTFLSFLSVSPESFCVGY